MKTFNEHLTHKKLNPVVSDIVTEMVKKEIDAVVYLENKIKNCCPVWDAELVKQDFWTRIADHTSKLEGKAKVEVAVTALTSTAAHADDIHEWLEETLVDIRG